MGGSSWSDATYCVNSTMRATLGKSAFHYTDATMAATPYAARKAHDLLDPKGVTRESRDSDAHPLATPVAVLFDVTGSMGLVPRDLQLKLPELFGVLLRKAYLTDPQILFGGIGDATCDKAPLQIGQFESGNEVEGDLERLYIEGGGGGQTTESYELGMYFMARHTSCDAWEKRGERGYLFIIGDEQPYGKVKRGEVEKVMGDMLQADIPIKDMIAELREKWHVFYIMPKCGSYWDREDIRGTWKELLGQHAIFVEDHDAICETIAMLIGVNEGAILLDEGIDDLKELGADERVVTAAANALKGYVGTEITKADDAIAALPPMPMAAGGTTRL